MVTHDMRELARMAAEEAVAKTFLTLGLDIKDPISVQNQFGFLRNLYYSARHVRNVAIGAGVASLVSGAGWVIWAAIKAGSALAK